ncbi:MAG: DHH family phosphoesterase [Lachnospiraceae bacterium]|nr:DHH family phosphoesterase [Lachnospiraceae bacterium]
MKEIKNEVKDNRVNILELAKDAKVIGISGHMRPDGDCVGSTLGLYLYLKKAVPKAKIVLYLEQPSDIFKDLKGYDEIQSDFDGDETYDLFFALDGEKSRLGGAEKYFDSAKVTVNIDHHISNRGSGKYNYVVPEASSASELVFDLMEEVYVDVDIAKAIYTGIIHDTGVFQYSNTAPKTLNIAAKLIAYGFDFSEIIDRTFYEKTYIQNQIMGRTLLESMLFMDGRCIVGMVDRKTMDFYGVEPKDLDGIVNQLRVIKGVDCAVFMYETDTLEYKVSMRSNDTVDVAKVAGFYGGGGHKKAAGCTVNGTFHDVINNLSQSIAMQMKAYDSKSMT